MFQPLLSHLDRTIVVRHQKLRVLNAATPVNVNHSHHWLHSLWTHDAFCCQCLSQFLCWDHTVIVHVHFSEYLYQHLLLFVCQELACNESLHDCLELVFEPKSMKVVDDLLFLRLSRCVLYGSSILAKNLWLNSSIADGLSSTFFASISFITCLQSELTFSHTDP